VPLQWIFPGQAVVPDQGDGVLHGPDRGLGGGQLGHPGVAGGQRIPGVGAFRQAVDQISGGGQ
jgi:hypothetical protein